MADINGTRPSFTGPNIPIVGQPYILKAVVPTVMAQCTCEGKEALLLIGLGATVKCPGCRRLFVLREFEGSQATNRMTATLDVGVAAKADA